MTDRLTYDIKIHQAKLLIQTIANSFYNFWGDRVPPILDRNFNVTTQKNDPTFLTWTNNNCESLNHILKMIMTKDRNLVVNSIFGPDGITGMTDRLTYDIKIHQAKLLIQTIANPFYNFWGGRVLPIPDRNFNVTTQKNDPTFLTWTNNNCESLNHILKMIMDRSDRLI